MVGANESTEFSTVSTALDRKDLRPEIALAWHRAALNGLDPGMEVRETTIITDVDRRSRLAIAAGPVLDRMIEELSDTRFSVLLADRTSRIIDRRTGQQGLDKALDRVLAVPGLQYLEETSGTNSLATAYELRRPIAVTGGEHFLDALKVFCCYGAPIIHPLTRRLEGVLDVSGPARESTTLLGPFLMRAVRDVEQRLLEGSRMAEQRLLAEFQAHSRNKTHAVLVFGDNMVLSNPVAADVVQNSDHAILRGIAHEIRGSNPVQRPLLLTSGSPVLVNAMPVADSPGGVLFDILPLPAREPASSLVRRDRTGQPTGEIAPIRTRVVLIYGEPGSGRTTEGAMLAGADAVSFDAAESVVDDEIWLAELLAALRGRNPVLIDNVHTLSVRLAARLAPAVRNAATRVVLTSSPLSGLDCEQSALAAEALDRRGLRPLRTHQHDFALVANEVLRRLYPDSSQLQISPSALQLLRSHPWPGNFRELTAVLEHSARGRTCGQIIDTDLPTAYRTSGARSLTPIEAAEREAIMTALCDSGGNKLAAASALGIGRTTLYDRLRRYGING